MLWPRMYSSSSWVDECSSRCTVSMNLRTNDFSEVGDVSITAGDSGDTVGGRVEIMGGLGAADVDSRLEEQLIDGSLYAFQEQTTEDVVMLNGFGTIVNSLGKRVKPYLPQVKLEFDISICYLLLLFRFVVQFCGD